MNQTFTIIPAIYHRNGQPYAGVMQSGLDAFGDPTKAKRMNAWTLMLSSDSPSAEVEVALRGGTNPADGADVIKDDIAVPQRHNLVPVTMMDYYLGDRITVTGVNHLVRVVGRVLSVSGIDRTGVERV